MHKLVVNPNTPHAWEIQLKDGENSVGRSEDNSVQLNDASVSGHHCQIIIQGDTAVIRDLGSTNGTSVSQTPVTEASLENGHSIRMGDVELIYVVEHTAATARVVPRSAIRLSGVSHAAPTATAVEEEAPPPAAVSSGPRCCKSHPHSAARFVCPRCNRAFCELCITSMPIGGKHVKACFQCGVACLPLAATAVVVEEKSFFRSLPGAFAYPFRGSGVLILIVATIVFAALSMVSGIFSLLITMAALGYLFSYMQGIIEATANDEEQMPELPAMDGLFGAFFSLAGTVLMSFGLAIGLAIAKFTMMEDLPTAAIIAATIFGCFYFPMAFLATAMKDTALASNPLIVVPAILKLPGQYTIAVIVMTMVFGVQKLGDFIAGTMGEVSFSTRSMSTMFTAFGLRAVLSLVSVYLLSVNMRVLGLLYVTNKRKLGWF